MAPIILILGATYINSAKLIHDFEENVQNTEFQPEASSIEVAEINKKSKRGWKIRAEKSFGNANLTVIHSKNIEAQIFDEDENLKIKVKSPKAYVNRNTGLTTLEERTEVLMIEKNTKMIADKFIINKGQPIEAIGNVQVFLDDQGINHINAEKAIINENLEDITLYKISESPVSDNMLMKGGKLNMLQDNSKNRGSNNNSSPRKLVLEEGAWIKNKNTTCQSKRMDIFLNDSGNPTSAVFTGSPVAIQNRTKVKANRIEYTLSNNKVKASGNVRSELI
ncbi:MAG: hypothetical protein QNJ31_03960 [Candidatus Caenarcaniphilales bacterium]|nr:hypothetical protein [Candidatus Caenarcaniphilales bacterium]